jgi:plasmid stabilization system protein ParE
VRIRILSPAQDEITRIIDFYDDRAPGLGHEFLDDLDKTWESLRDHPEAGAPHSHDLRRVVLGRFPFVVLYSIEPDEIVVHAVAHQRRRPDFWRSRE